MGKPVPPLLGPGLVARQVRCKVSEVLFVRAHLEASEGLGILFAESGGDLIVATTESQTRALDRFLADLSRELDLEVLGPVLHVRHVGYLVAPGPGRYASHVTRNVPRGEVIPLRKPPEPTQQDPRAVAAWRAWLRGLATDAEAAISAALAYDSLDDQGKDAWLLALEEDAPQLGIPKVALYAPLLSVENDFDRLMRIREAIGDPHAEALPAAETRALRGVDPSGDRVVVLVLPLYLSFVQVFSCRFSLHTGFVWARHEPFSRDQDAPRPGQSLEHVPLERTPMKPVVEELAHAVVAHSRRGERPPEELRVLSDLFSPSIEVVG